MKKRIRNKFDIEKGLRFTFTGSPYVYSGMCGGYKFSLPVVNNLISENLELIYKEKNLYLFFFQKSLYIYIFTKNNEQIDKNQEWNIATKKK